MQNYKDTNDTVHFLSDEDEANIENGFPTPVQSSWAAITQSEADSIANPPLTLQQVQTSQITSLSNSCAATIISGFTSDALGSTYIYPSKATDQQNLSASVLASFYPNLDPSWTTPFWCEDSAGIWAFVSHTAAQIQQVGVDAKNSILAAMGKNATLAAQVAAATTVADVQAIVWA